MSFEARALVVLIASPGDTAAARDAVERTITDWNRDRARRHRVVLLPLRWETDAVPELGQDGQAVINRQLVDECDIVVALFHSRLGAPTRRAVSGTAEEIERARQRGVPVHVYFSEMPIPRDIDPDERKRLNEYRRDLQAEGLLGSFVSLEDLSAKVRTALDGDANRLMATTATEQATESPPRAHAILRARYEFNREPVTDSRGRTRIRNRRERLVIENVGDAPAESVEIEVKPSVKGNPPTLHGEQPIERLLPRSFVNIMAIVHLGVASQWRVIMKWSEGGTSFEEAQTVTPF